MSDVKQNVVSLLLSQTFGKILMHEPMPALVLYIAHTK